MERNAMLQSAGAYAKAFVPNRHTAEPVRHVAVLTCMDARLDLFRLLGLEVGDSHLLRNAGGRATEDALRSLILSANALGTREFVVIHHTGCGLHNVTNESIAERIFEVSGQRPDMEFHPFNDEAVSVAEDVARIAACPFLPVGAVVWGAVYDVHTGLLSPIGEPQPCRTIDAIDAIDTIAVTKEMPLNVG
jgi:carbonic anhydrase